MKVGDGVGQVEQVSVLVHGGGAGLADVATGFDRVGVHHPEFFRDALGKNKKIKQVNMMQCETILCFASNECMGPTLRKYREQQQHSPLVPPHP